MRDAQGQRGQLRRVRFRFARWRRIRLAVLVVGLLVVALAGFAARAFAGAPVVVVRASLPTIAFARSSISIAGGGIGAPSGTVAVLQERGRGWRGIAHTELSGSRRLFALRWRAPSSAGRVTIRVALVLGRRTLARSSPSTVSVSLHPAVIASGKIASLPQPGRAGNVVIKGAADVRPGQVLAVGYSAHTPDGFLGKVVKVTHSGGDAVVQTAPATLAQAVGNGNLDLATLAQVSGGNATDSGIRAHAASASLFNPDLINSISCSAGAALAVTPSVSVSVTPSLLASFSFFGGLTSASFSLTGTATASLALQASANASCMLPSTPLLREPLHIRTFAGLVGGVPVVVVLQGQVYADANIGATAALTTDVSASASITGGISYNHGKFSPIFTGPNQDFQFNAPTVSATGTAQAHIEPALQMLLYGVAGPQLGVKTGLDFSASSTSDPWWSLDAPLSIEASLVAPILDLDSPDLTLYSHTFPLMAPPGQPADVTATPGDGSADISWQPPPANPLPPADHCACHVLSGYTVYLNGAEVATTSGATSATLSGLTDGTSYQVTVASDSSAGFPFDSLQTTPVTVTPMTVTTPATIDGTNALYGVACPSTSQCTAVDHDGQQVTFDPVAPGTPTPTTIDSTNILAAVVCPSTGQCTAVDYDGQQVTFDPTSPGTPTPTTIETVGGEGEWLLGVACPSTSQCTAVDYVGQQQVTFDPASPGPRPPPRSTTRHLARWRARRPASAPPSTLSGSR